MNPIYLLFLSLSFSLSLSCPAGKFNTTSGCVDCPAGFYSTRENSRTNPRSCTPCPPGNYNPYRGAQGLDVCIPCPENTISTAGSTSCTKCPTGRFSPGGTHTCFKCPPGQHASRINNFTPQTRLTYTSFRGKWFICYDGQSEFFCTEDEVINYECSKCTRGVTTKINAQGRCDECPEGTGPNEDRTACVEKTPKACGPGMFLSEGGECLQCRDDTISTPDGTSCERCPHGHIPNNKQDACRQCPPGTARNGIFSSNRCQKCKAGENTDIRGAAFCAPDNTPCARNFFRGSSGACETCSYRQRYDKRLKKCVNCPPGSLSNGGLNTKCRRCRPGSTPRSLFTYSQGRCVCNNGWEYRDGPIDFPRCRKCKPGTASSKYGSRGCEKCSPGFIAPNRGMRRCIRCEDGDTGGEFGQTRCGNRQKCGKGLKLSEFGDGCVVPKTNCPPGAKRINVGAQAPPRCDSKNCPEGTVLIFGKCSKCQTWERFDKDQMRCSQCPKGRYSNGGLDENCRFSCARGMTYRMGTCVCVEGEMKDGICVKCPKGQLGFEDATGCIGCPVGTRYDGFSETCDRCNNRSFTDSNGSTRCERCDKGLVTYGVEEASCVAPGGGR